MDPYIVWLLAALITSIIVVDVLKLQHFLLSYGNVLMQNLSHYPIIHQRYIFRTTPTQVLKMDIYAFEIEQYEKV